MNNQKQVSSFLFPLEQETTKQIKTTVQKEVRVITDENDDPWFDGQNVADILGYKTTEKMTRRLDNDEWMKLNTNDLGLCPKTGGNLGGTPLKIFLSESGLYHAIIGSKKPEAKKFRKWVTEEVLPCIRKHGAYMTAQCAQNVLNNPNTAVSLAAEVLRQAGMLGQFKQEISQLTAENNRLVDKCDQQLHIIRRQDDELLQLQAVAYVAPKPCPVGYKQTVVERHLRNYKDKHYDPNQLELPMKGGTANAQ